jgi:hypothetical protein
MTKSIDSPTGRLLAGLAVTLAAVGVFSFCALRQIRGLEDPQTRTEPWASEVCRAWD